MKAIVLALLLVACGGTVAQDDDAATSAPACFETQWGCSFCVPDAEPGTVGNIARVTDDGGVEFGSCISPAYCRRGDCVETP